MTSPRDAGTNPRARGSNPRAQQAQEGTPPAASPGGGGEKAGQEVATQILDEAAQRAALDAKLALGMPAWDGREALERALIRQGVTYSAQQLEVDAEYRARLKQVVLSNDAEALSRKEDAAARLALGAVVPTPPAAPESADERRAAEEAFMKSAAAAQALAMHDDECPVRKGKECSCRVLLRELESGGLEVLEERPVRWVEQGMTRDAVLQRVDDGLEVTRMVADPISAQNPPIRVVEQLPPRWVCNRCAMSIRGTSIDHRCDAADLKKAQSPLALARTLPADVKFGGAYRLTLWRDRAGDYHLGEMLVVAGRVVDERPIAGPESFNTIDAALLDAADRNLSP